MLIQDLQDLLKQTVNSQRIALEFMHEPKLTSKRRAYYHGKWMQTAETVRYLKKILRAAKKQSA